MSVEPSLLRFQEIYKNAEHLGFRLKASFVTDQKAVSEKKRILRKRRLRPSSPLYRHGCDTYNSGTGLHQTLLRFQCREIRKTCVQVTRQSFVIFSECIFTYVNIILSPPRAIFHSESKNGWKNNSRFSVIVSTSRENSIAVYSRCCGLPVSEHSVEGRQLLVPLTTTM